MPNQLIKILSTVTTMILLSWGVVYGAWPWQDDTLVTIDEQAYSTRDFQDWWRNFQDEGQPLPGSPEPFIDWTLQYREAERMKLYEDPQYQRKIMTFLKARTLMFFKAEEIDSKIKISDRDIRSRYEELYVPLYYLTILSFHNREIADTLLAKIGEDAVNETLLEQLAQDDQNKMVMQKQWLRPSAFDPEALDAVKQLKPGQLSPPLPWKKGTAVLLLHEKSQGSQQDYASVEEMIRQYLRKKQEAELTTALLQQLRQSYEVTIDQKRLQALDINEPIDSFSEEPLILTKNGNISEKLFMAQLAKQKRFRLQNGFPLGDPTVFKEQVANGIIDQTLTSWEGLARGYEQKPPLKDDYTFYSRHRLIKSLEARVLKPPSEASKEEIELYYRENIGTFTNPEVIRMVIVEGNEDALKRLWTEAALGGDFRQLAAKWSGHDVPVREVPVSHLDPEVKAVADTLTNGELSPVFTVKGHVTLLLLVERKPARTMPLAEVDKQIRAALDKEKAEAQRSTFLARLREQSSIVINDDVWQKLKKEMEQADAKDS